MQSTKTHIHIGTSRLQKPGSNGKAFSVINALADLVVSPIHTLLTNACPLSTTRL